MSEVCPKFSPPERTSSLLQGLVPKTRVCRTPHQRRPPNDPDGNVSQSMLLKHRARESHAVESYLLVLFDVSADLALSKTLTCMHQQIH